MKLSDNQKQKLVQDYINGSTWDELCNKYQTNLHTIHKILKSNNIQKVRIQESSWSLEKQELFKQMYLNNCTYKEMYESLNCKGGTLCYWVHKLNLPMRGSGRNNNYPNRFLENTAESNYWLGYIFADGHIAYNLDKRRGFIQLYSEKLYVIEKFKQWYYNIPKITKCKYVLKDGTIKHIYKATINDLPHEVIINKLGIELGRAFAFTKSIITL